MAIGDSLPEKMHDTNYILHEYITYPDACPVAHALLARVGPPEFITRLYAVTRRAECVGVGNRRPCDCVASDNMFEIDHRLICVSYDMLDLIAFNSLAARIANSYTNK